MKLNYIQFPALLILALFITSCTSNHSNSETSKASAASKADFVSTMQKHLDAVSNKDLVALKSTMSPEGKMQLIVPGSEKINTVDGFMDYHRKWFQDTTTTWTFETKILNTEIAGTLGMAITEIVYREPERNGEPYFNRMHVSYVLEKKKGKWYIIKDHASSIEKSTDKK